MTYKKFINQKFKEACIKLKEKEAIKFLLMGILNINASELYLLYDEEIPVVKIKDLEEKCRLFLDDNIPVQYILGYTNFYGLKFLVDENVLIPRFDTEVLIDEVIQIAHNYNDYDKIGILDIGTGSGCIAISLKKNIINSDVTATDISEAALNIAKKNARLHNQEIIFRRSDLFSNVIGKFDLIVSNPPYIDYQTGEVDEIVIANEPHSALFAGENGLYFYRQILANAKCFLNKNGFIVLEIGHDQKEAVTNIGKEYFPESKITVKKDLNNKDRIITIKT